VLSTELRNPILHIKSAAVRLRDFAAKHNDLKALKDLNAVYTTCSQMQHTLDALHEFFSPPLDAKPSIEITDAINRALKMIEPEFAIRKIIFKVKCQNGFPRVMLHEKLWEFVFEELLHHFGAMALSSKEKTPAISVSLHLRGTDIVVDIEGGDGSPFSDDSACDKKCGCIWVDGIDLKFTLMELVIFKAAGVIRHEQVDDKIFRTTLVIPKVL
jgi:light-regulated signal transduction histidine kinase (bacteriophytochrome)